MPTSEVVGQPFIEMSFKTKILEIHHYFEDDPDVERVKFQTAKFASIFHVGFEPINGEKGLGAYLHVVPNLMEPPSLPLSVQFNFTVSSLLEQVVYQTRGVHYNYEAKTGYGWTKFLGAELWDKFDLLREEDGFLLKVDIRSPSQPTPGAAAVLNSIHRTIRRRDTTDVCFIVFDGRTVDGKMTGRREVLADRAAVSDYSPTLKKIMNGEKSQILDIVGEDGEDGKDGSHSDIKTAYLDADSDFEDINDDDEQNEGSPVRDAPQQDEELDTAVENGIKKEEGKDEDDDDQSMEVDAELEVDEDEAGEMEENNIDRPLRMVVNGAASITWEALVYYLYTGILNLAPLSSSDGEDATRAAYVLDFRTKKPDRPAPCSPKSMYRLACELDILSLQKQCLDRIQNQLTVKNVVKEIFTIFTYKHKTIRDMEMDFLDNHWDEIQKSESFKKTILDVTHHPSQHTGEILLEIFSKVGRAAGGPDRVDGFAAS